MRPCPRPMFRFLAGPLLGASALAALAGPSGPPALPAAPPLHAARAARRQAMAPALAPPRAATAASAAVPAAAETGTLLDETGHLQRAVPAGEYAAWERALQREALSRGMAARLHLWVGETQLARDEQPLRALWHFRMAQRLSRSSSTKDTKGHEGDPNGGQFEEGAGLAAYDAAVALFYAGAYQDSASAFHRLLLQPTPLLRRDSRRCAGWYRYASACAGYHAQRAKLGIPEPERLDPLCGAAGLAACLRALSMPCAPARVAAACRHTGEGSSVADILAACPKLGVAGRVVKADDHGLRALPKPLIAHVEGDHFIAVVRADARGVGYLCSDCGRWPGGRIDLNWKQWHALQPRLFITVTRPGSRADRALAALPASGGPSPAPLRLASASLAQLHVWDTPQFSSLVALLKGHVFLIDSTSSPGLGQCGFRRLSARALPWQCPPMDRSPTQGSASAGDPVNLVHVGRRGPRVTR